MSLLSVTRTPPLQFLDRQDNQDVPAVQRLRLLVPRGYLPLQEDRLPLRPPRHRLLRHLHVLLG